MRRSHTNSTHSSPSKCTSLSSVTLGAGLQTIKEAAFYQTAITAIATAITAACP